MSTYPGYYTPTYFNPAYFSQGFFTPPGSAGFVEREECHSGYWVRSYWSAGYFQPGYWAMVCPVTITFRSWVRGGADDRVGRGRGHRRLIIEEVDEEFDEYLKYREKLVKRNRKIIDEEDMEAAALLLLAMEM